MASTQTLDVRRDTPIVIETPEGMIQIWRPQCPQYRKKIRIELPGDMRAFVGMERAMEHARFVESAGDGRVTPRYSILAAIRDGDGFLLGVRSQQFVRLVDAAPVIRIAAEA